MSNKGALDLLHPDDKEKYSRFMSHLSGGVENKLREVFRFRQGEGYDWFETYAIGLKSERQESRTDYWDGKKYNE